MLMDDVVYCEEVSTVFQPVVDLFGGQVWGYEFLSRGRPPVESACELFDRAERLGTLWELEELCRSSTLNVLSDVIDSEDKRVFINVTPSVFLDDRFPASFNGFVVERRGIRASQVVIELTERQEVSDYGLLSRRVEEMKEQGFRIAIDDLGAGHSGLIMLASCIPDYIKLDMALIRDIHEEPRKQHIVRSLVGLASQVESRIIAEGEAPDGLLSMTTRARAMQRDEISCKDLWYVMKNTPEFDHGVVLDGKTPMGLVTRNDFASKMGGAYGFHLFQNRPVEAAAKKNFLSVGHSCSIRHLSKLAMERCPDAIYDPVVVVDTRGHYMGTVTMKQVIARSAEIEVRQALTCNPLSGLPGNQEIQRWISRCKGCDSPFTLIYADLDRFKEYNDTYGFIEGDGLIKLTASVLQDGFSELGSRVSLGHVGGDDFVAVVTGNLPEGCLDSICREFDRRKRDFFHQEDWDRGFFCSVNRKGENCNVSPVTLSLAVIEKENLGWDIHPAKMSEIAASLKHRAKQLTYETGRSGWVQERRFHGSEAGGMVS
ncbi:MAG: EAL domain-containing protein [Dethiosulfovibrio sp.]|nr:EAL domain-containing protein [Dethiosulfovibrio sp.]